MSEITTERAVRDYKPFHRMARDTVWDQAFEKRDAWFGAISDALAKQGITALVTKSENGQYPPYVTVEGWRPSPGDGTGGQADPRIRGSLVIAFEALPYHQHPVVTTIRATLGQRAFTVARRPDVTQADAVEWVLYVLGEGAKPSSYRPVRDVLSNMVRAFVPFLRPLHDNRVERTFRNTLPHSLPFLLGAAGAVLGFIGFMNFQDAYWDEEISQAGLTMAAGAILLLGAFLLARRQRTAVSVIDRPTISPRRLLMLDSWHAVVPDLGKAIYDLQRKIVMNLSNREAAGITAEVERYGYRTPNGFDERDRIVVTKGQGVAHIHVYRFGEDLFVGWDSYLNWARWQETPAVSVRRKGMTRTEYRGLESGLYIPNQFDLIDLNSMAELVHRIVTDAVKASMEEHKIDQEVDFTIIRGDRDAVLDQEKFNRVDKAQASGRPEKTSRRWKIG